MARADPNARDRVEAPSPPATALLRTKLYAPRLRRELVPRPRLTARLDAGLGGALTLVCGPAGSGKTTVVGEWLGRLRAVDPPPHVAWLSLDEGDDDPVGVLRYLVAALQGAAPAVGEAALAHLSAPGVPGPVEPGSPTPALQPLLTDLINDLAALPRDCVLVLDDYHLVRAPAVHEAVAFLLDRAPPTLHVVIASRADPPLPLSRWRGRGQIVELRGPDLAFTADEAARFLRETMGLELAPSDVAALEERTEGWVAALQLVALSLRDRADSAGFVAAFAGSHRYVVDYLADEVLATQPPEVRAFLLRSAILERLCGPLCDALLADGVEAGADGQTLLEAVERANLFLVPLDAERRWYRYHHLFADVLRDRLRRGERGLEPELHRRASAWFEQEGLVDEAIAHALAIPDHARAADLVERSRARFVGEGRNATAQRWIEQLPADLVRGRPGLVMMYAWSLSASRGPAEVDARLNDALGESPSPEVAGEVATIRAGAAAYHGDPDRAIELARLALALLAPEHPLRGMATLDLGLGHLLLGEPAAAEPTLSAVATAPAGAFPDHVAPFASCFLGDALALQGRLGPAAALHRRTLERTLAAGGRLDWVASYAHAGLAGVLYEQGDLDGAAEQIAAGLERSRYGPTELARVPLFLTRARLELARGEEAAALATLDEAEQVARAASLGPAVAPVATARARLCLARGDLAAAARWAADLGLRPDDAAAGAPRPGPREVEYLTLARLELARGRPESAEPLLERLLGGARASGRLGRAVEILAVRALALAARERTEAALASLRDALALAEPGGYRRTFVDEGAPMAALLRRAAARDAGADYARTLLGAFDVGMRAPIGSGPRAPASVVGGRAPALVEPLSERELAVLHRMAAGASNGDIAADLIVAVSTVKTHVRNVLGKLGARNRTQAVTRARELGLL